MSKIEIQRVSNNAFDPKKEFEILRKEITSQKGLYLIEQGVNASLDQWEKSGDKITDLLAKKSEEQWQDFTKRTQQLGKLQTQVMSEQGLLSDSEKNLAQTA